MGMAEVTVRDVTHSAMWRSYVVNAERTKRVLVRRAAWTRRSLAAPLNTARA